MTSRQLENLHDRLSNKLYRLNTAKVVETDVSVKFKLEQQITETETEIEKVEAQLDGKTKQHLKNPYRGLSAFREQDEPFFFGRDGYIEQIHQTVLRQSFTAVLGASGSGKSSIIYAGLMPRLRRTPMSAGGPWAIAHFRPGQEADRHDPFIALAEGLIPLLHPELENDRIERRKRINSLAAGLKANDFSLLQIVSDIVQVTTEDRLLLFADQFEELYTLCAPETRTPFLDVMLNTIHQDRPAANFRLLLTMRADFLNKAVTYRPFADVLNPNSPFECKGDEKAAVKSPIIILGPMNTDELRDCITRPAHRAEIEIESGLTERILDDVAAEPGHLPLLEFALTRLWEEQTDGCLTHAAYDAIGGVEKALADQANAFFEGLPNAETQERVRRIFIQLVQPGAGTEDTRRLASRDDIGADNWEWVIRLADERLVVTGSGSDGDESVEIVHEALLRHWDKLMEWMEADRTFRAWQERLRTSLKQWQELDHDGSALLRGAVLAEGEAWLQQRPEDISDPQKAFLQAGIEARDREQQAEQERQAKMLQLEQEKTREAEARLRDVLAANRKRIKIVLDLTAVDLMERGLYAEVLPILDEAAELGVEIDRVRLLYANIAFIYSYRPDHVEKAAEIIQNLSDLSPEFVEKCQGGMDAGSKNLTGLVTGEAVRRTLLNLLNPDAYQRELIHRYFPIMIPVPSGEFMMGLLEHDPFAYHFREGEWRTVPVRKVTVAHHYIGQFPVTGNQYRLFYFCQCDSSQSPTKGHSKPLNAPIVYVSWQDAVKYCAWLQKIIAPVIAGGEYRLPSEAEWEYASRSGGQDEVWAGTNDNTNLTNYIWYMDNSDNKVQPVGLKKPNGLGLHDMSGNVWEWCADHWQEGYEDAPLDGSAHINQIDDGRRILRGGAYNLLAVYCRTTHRNTPFSGKQDHRNRNVGFRVLFGAVRT